MRQLTLLILLLLLCISPVWSEEETVYSLGKLEVTGRDLSRPTLNGEARDGQLIEGKRDGDRIDRRLVSLGEDRILLAPKLGKTGTVDASVGTYGTVRINAHLNRESGENIGFNYESSDGWREKSDFYTAGLNLSASGKEILGQPGDVSGDIRYDRRHLPGAVGFEIRHLERRNASIDLQASLQPDPLHPERRLGVEIGGSRISGIQTATNLDETGSMNRFKLQADGRIGTQHNLAVSAELSTSNLSVTGGGDDRVNEGQLLVRGEHEFEHHSLLSISAGLQSATGSNVQPVIDFTLRQHQTSGGDLQISIGRSARAWRHDELLANKDFYVRMTDATGTNLFQKMDYPVRLADYLHASYMHTVAGGDFTLFSEVESLEDERFFTVADVRDSTVAVGSSGNDTQRRAVGFRFNRLIGEHWQIALEGSKDTLSDQNGELPFHPEGKMALKLNWNSENNLAWLHIEGSDNFTVNRAATRVAGRTLADIGFEHRFSSSLKAGLRMENAFNKRYELSPGMPGRGRLTSATMSWRF